MSEISKAINGATATARPRGGMSGAGLLSSLGISLGILLAQVLLFCLLRKKFKAIYETKVYFGPKKLRATPLPSSFLGWIIPVIKEPLESLPDHVGLDAYFFLRYISFLIMLSCMLAVLLIPILVPIHATGHSMADGALSAKTGIDRLTIANISSDKTDRYAAHVVLCAVSSIIAIWCFMTELKVYHETRARHMMKNSSPYSSTTLLIKGLHPEYRSPENIKKFFGTLSHNIKNVWFNRDYRDIEQLVKEQYLTVEALESLLMVLIKKCQGDAEYPDKDVTPSGNLWRRYLDENEMPSISFPRVATITTLKSNLSRLNSRLKLLQGQKYSFELSNSCFVQFDSRIACFMAYRSIGTAPLYRVSPGAFSTDKVFRSDVIWSNLKTPTWMECIVHGVAVTVEYIIIFGWAIPMAIVSMITQVEYLVQLVPSLSWLTAFPQISKLVNSILSPLILSWLTSQVPHIFRWLALWKGYPTRTLVQMDVQKYLFLFLFVQLFLIITLATGLPSLAMRMVLNTSEGAITLASSLPRATNFFISYLVASALTTSGNTILHTNVLLNKLWSYWFSRTPRQEVASLMIRPTLPWGTIFPMVTNIGAIAMTYSLISPLILVASIVGLMALLFAFKYRIIYCYIPTSTADGNYYPRAIFQLFSGIYCSQLSLLGTTLLAQLPVHSVIVAIIILITVFSQHKMHRRFQDLDARIPLESDTGEWNSYYESSSASPATDASPEVDPSSSDIQNSAWIPSDQDTIAEVGTPSTGAALQENSDALFQHPCTTVGLPCVWLPKDKNGIAADQAVDMLVHFSDMQASMIGAELNEKGYLIVRGLPPDIQAYEVYANMRV